MVLLCLSLPSREPNFCTFDISSSSSSNHIHLLPHQKTKPSKRRRKKKMGKSPSLLWTSDTHFFALLMHDLLSFWSFITSHPLHFAYILFFSPYIIPLLLFLSPLLLSTSLLLLAAITVSRQFHDPSMVLPEFFGNTTCRKILDILKAGLEEGDDTIGLFEQFGKMVLPPIDEMPESDAFLGVGLESVAEAGNELCKDSSVACEVEHSSMPDASLENSKARELSDAGNSSEMRKEKSSKSLMRRENSLSGNFEGLQRDWSMRREKEWKRTLACKLFEERMTYKLCEERTVVEGCEDMDLLWEAYEVKSSKSDKTKKKWIKEKKQEKEEEEQEEQEEEEEEAMGEQLCCLQALRLSSGKFNLGVGRPNVPKISKVLKGMRIFHRSAKQSRKG